MRIARTTVAVALGAALLGLALSGCSVALEEPQPAGSKPSTQETAPVADEPDEEAAEPDEADEIPEDTSADTALSAENATERERLIGLATTTMPCPEGAPLAQHGAIIRVEGHCATLTIDLDAGVVIADDVDELVLNGDGTVVFAGKVSTLTVTGDVNSLYWTGDTPRLDDTGTANTLLRG